MAIQTKSVVSGYNGLLRAGHAFYLAALGNVVIPDDPDLRISMYLMAAGFTSDAAALLLVKLHNKTRHEQGLEPLRPPLF